MSHNVTIRFDFSDTSKYASIPLYIGVSATFTTIFIYIQSELSPLYISYSLGAFSRDSKKGPEFAPDILHMNAIFCQLKTIKKAPILLRIKAFPNFAI